MCGVSFINFTHSRKYSLFDKFTMEKKTFVIKFAAWAAVIIAVIIAILGIGWGKVIEGTLFAEVTKWITVGIGVIVLIEGLLLSTIIPLAWHWKEKRKDEKTDTVDKA